MFSVRAPRLLMTAAFGLALTLAGCSGAPVPADTAPAATTTSPQVAEPSPTAATSAPVAPTSAAAPTAAVTVTASAVVTATVTAAPVTVTVPPKPATNMKPVTKQVGLGSTVSLRYFDVTVSDVQYGDVEVAAKITVCYTHAHPEANADGTTRVSKDPWSYGMLDLEGATTSDYSFYAVSEFDTSTTWTPAYKERKLSLGECNTGWLGIRHGSPDLGIKYLRYNPKDFGDRITWILG